MSAVATIRIRLEPAGICVEARPGASLQDSLFRFGVEFPCGGTGLCKGCRVRVLAGSVPPSPEDQQALQPEEIAQGWRLACRLRPKEDITLEIAQWETPVLTDSARFRFIPKEGAGIAIDLGTTTIAAQSLDMRTGAVLGVRTALNPQAAWGGDVMSRVASAMTEREEGRLTKVIRECVGRMVSELSAGLEVREVVVAGNTVMHHLFCGLDVSGLAQVPFETAHGGLAEFEGDQLEWLGHGARLRFLPCLGGFVGSDILAGILATGLHESGEPACLIDLGTNGEIVVGNRERLLCASTAAGPAFEGGRIGMGMRADSGAIYRVRSGGGGVDAQVLGGIPPRGICGSGLVDVVALGLEKGRILPDGRLTGGIWLFAPPVRITQADVRQLQLAKAAVAAGIHILLKRAGLRLEDVSSVYLAGAFGNYVDATSARRIGLLPFPAGIVTPSGNTALRGAKMALFDDGGDYAQLRSRVDHVPLAADPTFQDIFVEQMSFPAGVS